MDYNDIKVKQATEVVQSFIMISRTLAKFTQQNAESLGLTLPQLGILNSIYSSPDKHKEAKKLKNAILSESKKGYYALFSQGTPLEPANWLNVVAFAFIGAAVLGGIGAGVDYLGDNTNLYHGSGEDKYSKRRRREERRFHGYSMY